MKLRQPLAAALIAAAGLLLANGLGAEAAALSPPEMERTGIVFENGGRIVSVKADGSGRRILTRKNQAPVPYPWDVGHDSEPEVSADGSKLLFLRTQFGKGRQQIIVSDLDGSRARPVFTAPMLTSRKLEIELSSPVFLPGGGIALVYSTARYRSRSSVFRDAILTMEQDGSGVRKHWLKKNAQVLSIDPSPDGRRFLVSGFSPRERQQIEVLNRQTGKSRVLRRDADEGRWSPDSRTIVFSSEHEKIGKECDWMDGCSYDNRIYTMNADGSGVRRVIESRARGFQLGPDFSPDGTRIVFYSDRNTGPLESNSSEIYSVGVDGSCLTWLTNGSPSSTAPIWAPGSGDSSPDRCGSAGREPLVEMRPGASAPYWLGPVFGTSMFESDGGKGRGFEFDMSDPLGFRETGLHYTGCTEYSPGDCDDTDYLVGYAGVCRKWPQGMLNGNRWGTMTTRRGALVMWPRPVSFGGEKYLSEVLVFTGRSQLSLDAILPSGKPGPTYGRMIAALRPAGEEQHTASLPGPQISRQLAGKAARVYRAVKQGASRARVARRFGVNEKGVGSWARFHRDLTALEKSVPVRWVNCPGSD